MRFSYDPRYNIAYIRFQPKSSGVESVKVSDELIVDMTPDRTIFRFRIAERNNNSNARIWKAPGGR